MLCSISASILLLLLVQCRSEQSAEQARHSEKQALQHIPGALSGASGAQLHTPPSVRGGAQAESEPGRERNTCAWLKEPVDPPSPEHLTYFRQNSQTQSGEDLTLLERYPAVALRKGGVILESGAFDGSKYSSSWAFERTLEWTAIHIEANPRTFEKLKTNRPASKRVINLNVALCAEPREVHYVDHAEPFPAAGIWQFMSIRLRRTYFSDIPLFAASPVDAKTSLVTPLQCLPLAQALPPERHNIHVWVLDVEGAEVEVLKATDFNVLSFGVIVKETSDDIIKEAQATDILRRNGYVKVSELDRSTWYINECLLDV